MYEPQNHTQWKKTDKKKAHLYDSIFYKILEDAIYIDRKQILGPELGEEGTAKGHEETFESDENAVC